MSHKDYLEAHARLLSNMHELTKSKQQDYCGKDSSAFSNVERVEKLGICSTETGILTRILDKIARLSSFAQKGEYAVSDEKVEDTVVDAANYLLMLSIYIKQKQLDKSTPEELMLEASKKLKW